MGRYIPSTRSELDEMLGVIGVESIDELYEVVPDELKIGRLDIPTGGSEIEIRRTLGAMAGKNTVFETVFRGAGAYRHHIPAIVKSVVSKEEFITAYTPYQPEISQGILQSIFEFQTMICELTGMDMANASVYDGASAAAEAAAMCRDRKRGKIYISEAVNPITAETIRTYSFGSGAEVIIVPQKDGVTDLGALAEMLSDDAACVIIQQPNFYGLIEDADRVAEVVHAAGAKFVMSVNPIAAAVLKTPAECGADIAVGEGQPLGLPLSFGGPYLGFMAATAAMGRKLPGRIVGETEDMDGRRGFVLTLQAREQHIRREKASSNICSNQALCALTASVYMSAMGPGGMVETAEHCYSKAHYAAALISEIPGYGLRFGGEFFHEFLTECPDDIDKVMRKLEKHGILGGYPADGGILWCVTEMNTKDEIDTLVNLLKEVG